MSDAEHTILAALLQRPSRVADIALLDPEFFEGRYTRALFTFTRAYFRKRGGKNALDFPLARNLLEKSRAKIAEQLVELVDEYERLAEVSDAEFRDALAVLATERQRNLIKDHGTAAVEMMIDGEWKEAREEMRAGLLAADDADLDDDRPADIRSPEEVRVERELLEREPEEDERTNSFDVGFKRFTDRVSFRRRELTILGGYAADGKTQFSKTLAYNACMLSQARVLFVALEMDKREMRVLFVAHHAATLDPRGVDYRAILEGSASPADKKLYSRALDDFQVTPHEDVEELLTPQGALHVWAPRKRIDMARFTDRVRAMRSELGLDVVVGDYLELIQPTRDLKQYRLNLKDMAEETKALAREEDVWAILNHQISRSGRDAAEKRQPKHYLMRDLGESSGIERAGDHILWVYTDDALKDERESKIGIAKARKGRTLLHGTHVYADYAKGFMSEIEDD